ncbi:uncharacterized protein LOC123671145 [Harmonia axyridis]|uniref:uncharacterized protein LOC123671145 n=1 Tax=Harmonia axyridis TaxID=115357 RepID=UPI001E277605|nr:uncharacterized protein LOC123671145 [Harmonia axyridis]XP_045460797.1 uncharacterized protein LOC123671145 [Harmonia axyridis]
MNLPLRMWYVALLAAMVVLESRWTEAAPRMTRREDMLKDLMKLDQYYSSIARPSLRSVGPDGSISPKIQRAYNMLKLQSIDRIYADRTRPRYGKRAQTGHLTPLDFDIQYQSEDNGDYSALRR